MFKFLLPSALLVMTGLVVPSCTSIDCTDAKLYVAPVSQLSSLNLFLATTFPDNARSFYYSGPRRFAPAASDFVSGLGGRLVTSRRQATYTVAVRISGNTFRVQLISNGGAQEIVFEDSSVFSQPGRLPCGLVPDDLLQVRNTLYGLGARRTIYS